MKPQPPRAGLCARKIPPWGPLNLHRYSYKRGLTGSADLGYPLGSAVRSKATPLHATDGTRWNVMFPIMPGLRFCLRVE